MKRTQSVVLILAIFLFISGCTPGSERFTMEQADFWAGLWHGFICVFTFVIGLFSEGVRMYEVHNVGNWYDLGFIIGALVFLSGGWGSQSKRCKSIREREWDEIGEKIEEKVRRGIKSWVDETESKNDDREEIGKKIEEKIKRELRNWVEK